MNLTKALKEYKVVRRFKVAFRKKEKHPTYVYPGLRYAHKKDFF